MSLLYKCSLLLCIQRAPAKLHDDLLMYIIKRKQNFAIRKHVFNKKQKKKSMFSNLGRTFFTILWFQSFFFSFLTTIFTKTPFKFNSGKNF